MPISAKSEIKTLIMFDYRTLIGRELEHRRARNPLYSLRALARDIGMPASRLSEAVNSVRGLSPEAARKICKELTLSSHERRLFLLSVQAQHARSRFERMRAADKLENLTAKLDPLPQVVDTMTGWVEAALLKMNQHGRDLSDIEAVASSLAVPGFMITNALRFLTRLGFVSGLSGFRTYLEQRGAGRRLNIDYQQVLDKAYVALRRPEKDTVFLVDPLFIDRKKIPLAQKIMQNMLNELKTLEDPGKNPGKESQVYFAAAQLYSVEMKESLDD